MKIHHLITATLVTASIASSEPQSVDCVAPPVAMGLGSTPFTLIDVTTPTPPEPPCGNYGSAPTGYFVWTAPMNGSYLLRLETASPESLVISVFDGPTCGAPCLASSYSLIPINAPQVIVNDRTAGDQLLIQILQDSSTALSGDLIIEAYPGPPPVNDECSTPTLISGLGPFAYDTTGATTSTVTPQGGGFQRQDIYYEWRAPAPGPYVVRHCAGAARRRLHVYRGAGCSAQYIWSADGAPSCPAIASGVLIPNAAQDEVFLIRIASADYSFGPGEFLFDGPHPHNNCSSPLVVFDEASFVIDPMDATASNFSGGPGSGPGCGPVSGPDTFFTWTPACGGEYTIAFTGFVFITTFLGSNCGATCYDSSIDSIVVQAQAGQDYLFRWEAVLSPSVMDVTITRNDPPCPDLVVETCVPTTPHHEGGFVTLGSSDFEVFQNVERLRVLADGGPANEFGMLLVSAGAGSNIPLNQGVLCLDGPIGRYDPVNAQNLNNMTINSVGSFDGSSGEFRLPGASEPGFLVPTFLPNPPGGTIAPGDQWYFQLWYRDRTPGGAPSSNMSDVICVTFP